MVKIFYVTLIISLAIGINGCLTPFNKTKVINSVNSSLGQPYPQLNVFWPKHLYRVRVLCLTEAYHGLDPRVPPLREEIKTGGGSIWWEALMRTYDYGIEALSESILDQVGIQDSTGTLYRTSHWGKGVLYPGGYYAQTPEVLTNFSTTGCWTSNKVIDPSVPECNGVGNSGCYRAQVFSVVYDPNDRSGGFLEIGVVPPVFTAEVYNNCVAPQGSTVQNIISNAITCPSTGTTTIYAKTR